MRKFLAMLVAVMTLAAPALAATTWTSWKDGQDNTALCATPGHTVHIYVKFTGDRVRAEMNVPASMDYYSQVFSSHATRTVKVDTGRTYGFDVDAKARSTNGSTPSVFDSWLTCEF